jgi:hypothetical protein
MKKGLQHRHLELGETLLQVFFVTLPDVKLAGAVEALEKQGRPVSAGIWKQCQKNIQDLKTGTFYSAILRLQCNDFLVLLLSQSVTL